MDIADRFKELRKNENLSQTEFGKRVGVTIGVVKNIENKLVEPKELFIKLVCKEYHVNYLWLTEGKGEMYDNSQEHLLDELSEEYKLDELDKKIARAYLQLGHEERLIFKKFLKNIFDQDEKK